MAAETTAVVTAENHQQDPGARRLSFYTVEASIVGEAPRKLLEVYSGIAPDQVDEHILRIRQRAFNVFPYPCIGMFRFLDLSILQTAHYNEILERLKGGDKILDLGCCFGQELRQLAFDGAPFENLYGSDLRPEFIDLGYELFQDKDKFKGTFIPADVFDPQSPLKQLEGQVSIVYTGAFFHLFDLAAQVQVAKRVVRLLKPEPGSLLVGRQVGNQTPGEYAASGYSGERPRFRHNEESWNEFWRKIGDETGTKWKVESELDSEDGNWLLDSERKLMGWRREAGARRLRFVVTRL